MTGSDDQIARLERRLERERRARREAEQIAERTTSSLYDRQRELELLEAVGSAAAEAATLNEVLRVAIDAICAHTGWPVGHAWVTTEPDGKLASSRIWSLRDPARFEPLRRVSEEKVFEPGEGLPGLAVSSGRPAWMEDVMTDERFPRRRLLPPDLVHAGFGVPVTVAGEGVAMMEFFADRPLKPDAALLDLAAQIGTQLGRVAERMQARDAIAHQALHDRLTGLPNRALFLDRLGLAQARSARTPSLTGVLAIDLDRFKSVNDSFGHAEGDRVLVEVARRLDDALRPADTIARIDGDEFVVLCEDLVQESEALLLAERLQLELIAPFQAGDGDLLLTSSIGVAVTRGVEDDSEALMRDADAAKHRAKDLGGGRHELFDPDMRERVSERRRIERALGRAIEGDELCLHYQEVVSLEDRTVRGVEALVRWEDPERGLVSPGEFIPLAETTGLILPLGAWVLRHACHQAANWRSELGNGAPVPVNVNLSARQLVQDDLAETVRHAMAEVDLDPRDLSLEITESALMESAKTPTRTLAALRELGVRVLLDDFGTGYSSLSYLQRFPIDVLKIDRSFISNLGVRPEASAIVEAIVGMGHALDLEVVAEGIETEAQAREATRLGCDLGQGFLFSIPAPAETLTSSTRPTGVGLL